MAHQQGLTEARAKVAELEPDLLRAEVDRALAGHSNDPLTRRTASLLLRYRYARLLDRLRRLAGAHDRLVHWSSTDATQRARFETLLRLARLAGLCGEFPLARDTLRRAVATGVEPTRVAARQRQLAQAHEVHLARNSRWVEELLVSARAGKLETEIGFRDALFRLSSDPDRQTVTLLVQQLRQLTRRLRSATRDALLATLPAGTRPEAKEQLRRVISAVQSPPPSDVEPELLRDQWKAFWKAVQPLVSRESERSSRSPDRPSGQVLLARIQTQRLRAQGRRDDRVLALVCNALGYLEDPRGPADALTDYLYAEWDEGRAIRAGRSLARLSRHDPEARRALVRLSGLWDEPGQRLALPGKWPANGAWWREVCRELIAAGWTGGQTAAPTTALAYQRRGLLRSTAGDLAGAIADYSEAIRRDPTSAKTYVNRGLARQRTGDLAGAMADYSLAIHQEDTPA